MLERKMNAVLEIQHGKKKPEEKDSDLNKSTKPIIVEEFIRDADYNIESETEEEEDMKTAKGNENESETHSEDNENESENETLEEEEEDFEN